MVAEAAVLLHLPRLRVDALHLAPLDAPAAGRRALREQAELSAGPAAPGPGEFLCFYCTTPRFGLEGCLFFFFLYPLLLAFVQGLFPFCHVLQMRVPSQLGRGADGTDQAY